MKTNNKAVTGGGNAPRVIEIRGRKFHTEIRDGKEYIGVEIKPDAENIVPSHHGTMGNARRHDVDDIREIQRLNARALKAEAQRDELLAALISINEALRSTYVGGRKEMVEVTRGLVQAAIAKVESNSLK